MYKIYSLSPSNIVLMFFYTNKQVFVRIWSPISIFIHERLRIRTIPILTEQYLMKSMAWKVVHYISTRYWLQKIRELPILHLSKLYIRIPSQQNYPTNFCLNRCTLRYPKIQVILDPSGIIHTLALMNMKYQLRPMIKSI